MKQLQKKAAKNSKAGKALAEYRKIEKRLAALKKIVRTLYEDYASDLLDSDSYRSLLADYMQEQKQLSARLAALEASISSSANVEKNVQKLQDVFAGNLRDEVLTANLLNRVIERIEVFHAVKIDGKKSQGITIVYRFIGADDEL